VNVKLTSFAEQIETSLYGMKTTGEKLHAATTDSFSDRHAFNLHISLAPFFSHVSIAFEMALGSSTAPLNTRTYSPYLSLTSWLSWRGPTQPSIAQTHQNHVQSIRNNHLIFFPFLLAFVLSQMKCVPDPSLNVIFSSPESCGPNPDSTARH
jgi:hypothetical protein